MFHWTVNLQSTNEQSARGVGVFGIMKVYGGASRSPRSAFEYGFPMSTKGWSADWIWHPNLTGHEPCVLVFRRRFSLSQSESIVFHVSADQRYDLYLDGVFLSKGPELGDPLNWFYHSYRVELCPGDHVIVARVHWIGDMAPLAQMTVRGGFILYGEGSADEYLSTGKVEWEVARMDAYTFERSELWWGVCACGTVDGSGLIPGFESGCGTGFVRASKMIEGAGSIKRARVGDWWRLKPSTLPDMVHRRIDGVKVRHAETVDSIECPPEVRQQRCSGALVEGLEHLVAGKEMTVPRNTSIRAIIDMQDYYCAYPELRVSGGKGSRIRLLWAESLYHDSDAGRADISWQGQRGRDRRQAVLWRRRHLPPGWERAQVRSSLVAVGTVHRAARRDGRRGFGSEEP